jgi:outer membrane protein assembly factor BamE (lipoprotein component of BamABCDE complex)
MSFKFKNHLNKVFFILFIILNGCKLQEPAKNHGILFLENRTKKLVIQKSNKNDVLNVIGQPHSKSINDVNIWFYMERILTKGKYHKLGKHVLKTNNVLVLQFDKYGVLQIKEILTKDDLKKLSFSKKSTKNELTKKSFVEKFLSSIKQKMYGNRK